MSLGLDLAQQAPPELLDGLQLLGLALDDAIGGLEVAVLLLQELEGSLHLCGRCHAVQAEQPEEVREVDRGDGAQAAA